MSMMLLGLVAGILVPALIARLLDTSGGKLRRAVMEAQLQEDMDNLPRFSYIPTPCQHPLAQGRGFVAPTRRRVSRVGGFINVG